MHNSWCVVLCALVAIVIIADAARILAVFPTPSLSHQVVFRPVTLELSKRGHEVVVITTDPIFDKGKAPPNYTEIDVKEISYKTWKNVIESSSGRSNDIHTQMKIIIEKILFCFEKQLQLPEVQNVIRGKAGTFDLLIIEACARPALVLSHVLNIPTIVFSSFGGINGLYEAIGAPNHISLYPLPLRQRIRKLSLWEKITDYYSNYLMNKLFADMEEVEHRGLTKIFGSDLPTAKELKNNIDMVFLNINPLWDFNRPVPPNVIYLGSLHQNPEKDLPKELKSFLDFSLDGVIYMSLGTNVQPSMLPREKIQIFLKVFGSLPYNVLFKWDRDELEEKPNNVHISKWFPQSDLLHHPNIKLFITQGGLQSTDEAITAGVPLLGIPMLADQWYNTELYLHYNIGVKLDMETLSEQDLVKAINTVLRDDSYRKNIVQLRTLMRDQPQTSLERAIWWTEYVLRHGGAKHLRCPGANITWTEYLELELVAVVLITVLALILVFIAVTKLLIRSLFSNVKFKIN